MSRQDDNEVKSDADQLHPHPMYAYRMGAVRHGRIVLLVDDCEAMHKLASDQDLTQLPQAMLNTLKLNTSWVSRWDEARAFVYMAIQVVPPSTQLDVHFLNRDSVMNVTSWADVSRTLAAPPHGDTRAATSIRAIRKALSTDTSTKGNVVLTFLLGSELTGDKDKYTELASECHKFTGRCRTGDVHNFFNMYLFSDTNATRQFREFMQYVIVRGIFVPSYSSLVDSWKLPLAVSNKLMVRYRKAPRGLQIVSTSRHQSLYVYDLFSVHRFLSHEMTRLDYMVYALLGEADTTPGPTRFSRLSYVFRTLLNAHEKSMKSGGCACTLL